MNVKRRQREFGNFHDGGILPLRRLDRRLPPAMIQRVFGSLPDRANRPGEPEASIWEWPSRIGTGCFPVLSTHEFERFGYQPLCQSKTVDYKFATQRQTAIKTAMHYRGGW
jgi:hypothetical protein